MTTHDHTSYVPGCYRCELGRDEAFAGVAEERDEYRKALVDLIAAVAAPTGRLRMTGNPEGEALLIAVENAREALDAIG
jgi:hypothetical protein